MIIRKKFNKSNGGHAYVEFNPENKTYSTNYYAANGGWHKSEMVRLKDIRATVKMCEELGYEQVDRCEE